MLRSLPALLLGLALVVPLGGCGDEMVEPEAPTEAPTAPAEKPTPGTVTVEKPTWKDGQGNPVESPTPRTVKRWNGLISGTWKEPIEGVEPDQRAVVLHAMAGSPARAAGLRAMDVIVESAGKPVKTGKDYLGGARTVEVGQSLDLVVMRDGKRVEVSVPMVERPEDMISWRKEHFPGTEQVDYELELLRGGEGTVADTTGKPQVLYFWATWCGPCRSTSPAVSKLHDELGDKVQVVGISSEEKGVIEGFIAKHPDYTYPVGWDATGEVKRYYEVKKLPTIVLIDADGKVKTWEISVSGVNRVLAEARKMVAG